MWVMVGALCCGNLNVGEAHLSSEQPGFLRTDMTKRAGFEQFYESGRGTFRCFLRVQLDSVIHYA
jgi:hypothetical protein